MPVTRRRFLTSVATRLSVTAAGAAWVVSGCAEGEAQLAYPHPEKPVRDRGLVEATPPCGDAPRPTTARISQGSYYLPETPERTNLVEGRLEGEPLMVLGVVMDQHCEPIAGAALDFWQADAEGRYDEESMALRGHQFTDAVGAYQLRSVKPGSTSEDGVARAPHLGVKVQGPGGRVLTTRLYFPDEAANGSDPLFDAATQMEVVRSTRGVHFARFDFVLPRSN